MEKTNDEVKAGLECCRESQDCTQDNMPKCPYYEKETCLIELVDDALALIQQLEAKVPRWISVEERLPEGVVIAANFTPSAYGYKECIIGYVSPPSPTIPDGYYAENEFEILQGVTHWMPMPELLEE